MIDPAVTWYYSLGVVHEVLSRSVRAMGNTGCCASSDGKPIYEALSAGPPGGRKKALLVGINYRNMGSELRGCINDTINMQESPVY